MIFEPIPPAQQPERSRAARSIRALILLAGRIFYPQITLIGQLPAGPLLLVANHPNGLLDGLTLLLACERPIAFLAKSTFFANPLLAPILRAFGAIPVYRPADYGKRGGPAAQQDANQATFAAAHSLLRRGGQLAIFPEGTPNPQRILLPLKTGAARIALETEHESGWMLGLQIVPVGIWFQEQASPRTAALVLIGAPVGMAGRRAAYEAQPQLATRALTAELQEQLQRVASAAAQAGMSSHSATISKARGSWRSRTVRMIAAPFAIAGYLLALPGIAFGNLLHWGLTRRHRASVGTAQLVARTAGIAMGWLCIALTAAWVAGPWAGVGLLIAGPALGSITLHWMDAR